MKKFYFLIVIFCIALANESSGQVYNSARSGNWSNTGNTPNLPTWDASGKPASTCTNCTITIKANQTVTLNESVTLKGASTLVLEAGAKLVIINSKQAYGRGSLASGFNIILDAAGSSKIVVASTAKIDAGPTNTPVIGNSGYYDGVFTTTTVPNIIPFLPATTTYTKVIGNPLLNSIVVSFLGTNGFFNPGVQTQSTLSGPASISSNGTLPVELTSFSAVLNDDAVNLAWSVDQQIDFDHFEVTRSSDGSSWNTLDKVAAIPTKGVANYAYTDGAPLHGINYYRLKAVDIDGNFKYSQVALVRGTLINGVQFANPVRNGSLIVSFGADVKSNLAVRLLSTTGQTMQETQVKNPAGSTILLPVGAYAKGVYLLHIKADDGSQKVYKVVLSN